MRTLAFTLSAAAMISGCTPSAPRRPEFSGGYPIYDCPPHLEGQVHIAAEVFPIAGRTMREYSVPTVGAVQRRLSLSVTPAGLARDDRIVWSSTSIYSYGGTFVEWSRMQTEHSLLSPDVDDRSSTSGDAQPHQANTELATVKSAPGQIKITRIARGDADLAGIHSVDVSIMPGGSVVDDVVLRSLQLWDRDGSPLPPHDARVVLASVRHPPGLDVVQAAIQLDYVVQVAETREEWACSAETRATLVDQDSLRQPFWDLGVAWKNAGRREWLALFNSEQGAVRMVFDSPATANSFADWLRTSRAAQIHGYTIAVFTPVDVRAGRPYGPVGDAAMKNVRPLKEDDLAALKVGPVGEP